MYTFNRKIGCAPFVVSDVKSEVKAGFALVDQQNKLAPLRVLFNQLCPSHEGFRPAVGFMPGMTIYVRGEQCRSPWAKEVLRHSDGTEFILVPEEQVVAFEEIQKNDLSDPSVPVGP